MHSDELHNLYSSQHIIRVMISRMKRLEGYVARMGDIRNTKSSLKNLKGRDHLEYLSVDGKIILKWIVGKPSVRMWTKFI